tara:strand:+ start:1887 stop:2540 length:654 start_codon:yes stop_codon:yes gene_type:complete
MKIKILFIVCICNLSLALAQVGINTSTPSATLDVVGDVKTDAAVYLENPGEDIQIRDSKLLILTASNQILKYDISISKYGPINFSEFVFQDLSTDGLQDYDTKISADDYIVTVQGYYFLQTGTGSPNIVLKSNVDHENIEGYQIYAYKNIVTNTWFLRAFVNDSKFRKTIGTITDTSIDLFLNIIIYRNNFITKEQSDISVDMSNLPIGTAPLPAGF